MADRDLSPSSTSSTRSNITVQTDKQANIRAMSSASPSSSTPPTSLDDEASVLSEVTKIEQVMELIEDDHASPARVILPAAGITTPSTVPGENRRPARSSRKSVTTYNVQILAGTAIHTPTKYLEKHHKSVVHGDLPIVKKEITTPVKEKLTRSRTGAAETGDLVEQQLVAETAQAARRRTSSRLPDLRKEVLSSRIGDTPMSLLPRGKMLLQKSLRRTASDSGLKHTALSSSTPSLKRPRTALEADDDQTSASMTGEDKIQTKPKTKVWLRQGLYVGQHRDFDARLSESQNRVKKRTKKIKENTTLPAPMFACERLLNEDPKHVFRDFKLPFDIYNPLPRKVKVDGWVKLHKNRFIGEASSLWKRDKQDSSQCYCKVEDGCGEACHNRIMAYECDNTNCPLAADQCRNRPFAELKKRSKGNRYDYGVEVVDTENRGYGVRTMRPFEPHQIIVEYAGEIITQQECERRMKQVYKKDKCYYLMSFDNKMIIDATRGTIARFVNHSCEPNCEMIKWTVNGEPRMALFAGSKGVMTGEELTYDYNFDPFSQKNIQICRCGTASCRGVLGPKPKKPVEEKSIALTIITGTKRKIQDALNYGRDRLINTATSSKKRKTSMSNVATTKLLNASAQSKLARERTEREAFEHSRQIASRQDRALKRSVSDEFRRRRSEDAQATRSKTFKVARRTAKVLSHKSSRIGALKAITKPSRMRPGVQVKAANTKTTKALGTQGRASTPRREFRAEGSRPEDDTSPNITPASLRSASRKALQWSSAEASPVGGRTTRRGMTKHTEVGHNDNLAVDQETNRNGSFAKADPVQRRPRSGRGR